MFASEEEVFASGEEGLPHPVCGLRTYFLQTDIPFFPYIPHLHLFIFHFPSHRWGLLPICTFFTRLSSHLRFQNWFLIMCVWYVCKIVTKKKMTKLLNVATILTVLTDSSSFVMLHPTSFVCTLWNGNQCAQIIFVIQRLPGSSTQPAARNKLMVLSPALQNSILPVTAPAKSFAFAHPFTHYTFCASITSGGGDLV